MVKKGLLTFQSQPTLIETAVVVGPLEEQSPFAKSFDHIVSDERISQETNEKGHRQLIEDASGLVLKKAFLTSTDIDFLLIGDLVNQMTPSSFAARNLKMPYIGLFAACATSVSSLLMAAALTEAQLSTHALIGASSQHNAIERQFRYPVEYGSQKPATSQWTATAAGMGIVSSYMTEKPIITKGTIGHVIDLGITDPFNMGAAMAPAAADTLFKHLRGHNRSVDSYDLIMTGDLGAVGFECFLQIIEKQGIKRTKCFQDAGASFYGENDVFQAGASGAGCSAAIYFSDIYQKLLQGTYRNVLLIATGSLLSPLTYQQGETIPCIAHAVELTMKE